MQGTIKTYLPEKHYGFIKGQDEKDYFFHENDFLNKSDIQSLIEGAIIDFHQKATPKGYQAVKCQLLTKYEKVHYIIPENFITTKHYSVKNWDMIELGNWLVTGTSVESPDDAKDEVIRYAKKFGANALVQLRYSKSTGSKPSDSGKGIYHFTIHHFKGRIATVARRHAKGKETEESLQGINQRASIFYKEQRDLKEKKHRSIYYILIATALLSAILSMLNVLVGGVVVAIGAIISIFLRPKHDNWLEKIDTQNAVPLSDNFD